MLLVAWTAVTVALMYLFSDFALFIAVVGAVAAALAVRAARGPQTADG